MVRRGLHKVNFTGEWRGELDYNNNALVVDLNESNESSKECSSGGCDHDQPETQYLFSIFRQSGGTREQHSRVEPNCQLSLENIHFLPLTAKRNLETPARGNGTLKTIFLEGESKVQLYAR